MNSSREHSNFLTSTLSQSLEDRGYEDYVLKLSNGRCFFNRRYLILRNKVIAYYQDKPDPTTIQKPKGKVHILDAEVKKVDQAYAKKKSNPFMFQISFTPQKKKVFWIFAVNSLNIFNQWMEAFDKSRSPVEAIHEEIDESESKEEKLESEEKESQNSDFEEENLKKNLEIEQQRYDKKKKELEEQKRQNEAEIEHKRKEEEKQRKKIEKVQKSRFKKNRKILESFWDFRIEEVRKTLSDDLVESGFKIFQIIGEFNQAAVQAVKVLASDLLMPEHKRKVSYLNENRYLYKNLLMFLAIEEEESSDIKMFGHEFRSLQMLHQAIFLLDSEDFLIRIPLTALVDLKGVRVLVMSVVPIDSSVTTVHGYKDQEYFISETSLYKDLSNIAQLLNVKEQVFQWESGIVPLVHLSAYTQIHQSLGYSEISDLEFYSDSEHLLYITQAQDILPLDLDFNSIPSDFTKRIRPEFFSDYSVPLTANGCVNLTESALEEDDFDLCEASLKIRTDKISEFVELLDSLTLMPIDSKSFTFSLHSNGINCRYIGLIAQRTALPHIRDLCYVEIIARTCKRIFNQQMADFIFEHEEKGLETLLESSLASVPAVKIENNYFRHTKKIESLQYHPENFQDLEYRKISFLQRFESQLHWPSYKTIKEKIKENQTPNQNSIKEISLKDAIVDYLNLIFGVGKESDYFWDEILINKAKSHFNIPSDKLEKTGINLHALLHSVCFHCGLLIEFSKDILLGKTENPFSLSSLEKVKEKIKFLKLECLENKIIKSLMEGVEEENRNYESAILSLKISKLLHPDPEYLGDPFLLAQLGEISIKKGDMELAINYAKDALLQVHPLNAEGVKSWCVLIRAMMASNMQDKALQCFDHALTALEYHWGPYHPLHCILYSILAFLYMEKDRFEDALILYKNSLMCSLRVLGPNHPHTAEIYIELGKLYKAQNEIEDALNALEKGYNIYEAALGKTANATLYVGGKLVKLYLKSLNFEKTRGFVEKIVMDIEKSKDSSKSQWLFNKLTKILEVGKAFSDQPNYKKFREFLKAKLKSFRFV